MKYYLSCLLVIFYGNVFGQATVDSFIRKVENGMEKQAVAPTGVSVPSQNIYDVMKAQHVNGISVAVVNKGKIEWAKAYGVSDKSKEDSVTTETLFQSASIGKVITAMAALHLVKEGKIALDEEVNSKLKRWKVTENNFTINEKVTLRRLLSHSAGFKDEYGFEGYLPGSVLPSLLQMLNSEPPANTNKKLTVQTIPGTKESYSGGGYLIIQQLIEDVTQQSFSSYVQATIFDKLDMTHSIYEYYPDSAGKTTARGHDEKGKTDKQQRYRIYPEMAAAGPWTTATDLAKLVIQIQQEFNGTSSLLLDTALCKEMMRPQINYRGLGVHLTGAAKSEAFWHAGNNAGFTSLLYGIIHTGQGAVVLTNSDDGVTLALQLMTSVATVYDWPVMKSYRSEKLSVEEMKNYKGRYQTTKGSTVAIDEDKNGLVLIVDSPKQVLPISRIGADLFLIDKAPDFARLIFATENSKVTALTIAQNLGTINQLKKIE